MAAIRWASWSMMSSKVWAPGKNWPCLARNSLASGSPPPIRWRMSSLRSRTISRLAARSSGRHRLDRLGHAGHELVEHLALELLDELIEPFARVRLEEVVVLEAADPLADVGRQRVELVEPPRRDVAQHLPQVLGRAFGVRAATPRRGDARPPRAPRRRSRRARAGCRRGRRRAGSARASPRAGARADRAGRCSPAMSPRVGSPVRQPRSISRRSASARSPSAIMSSASASRISSASRSASCWLPSQAE